ncbi:hypothetical protein [Dysgonomonas gadei]|uniref:hypothetical protein n=1 Tax=Dysgonomonas gadei TaxID=156974 RepID=UPI003AEFEB7B
MQKEVQFRKNDALCKATTQIVKEFFDNSNEFKPALSIVVSTIASLVKGDCPVVLDEAKAIDMVVDYLHDMFTQAIFMSVAENGLLDDLIDCMFRSIDFERLACDYLDKELREMGR